ncbi:MAG: hypothetical protein EAZ41_09190 [Sphingobacteriia bacterium]|nr:MAG: hypothetical protein EAZ41_09190 [Sphingobacteriia bacterium]
MVPDAYLSFTLYATNASFSLSAFSSSTTKFLVDILLASILAPSFNFNSTLPPNTKILSLAGLGLGVGVGVGTGEGVGFGAGNGAGFGTGSSFFSDGAFEYGLPNGCNAI